MFGKLVIYEERKFISEEYTRPPHTEEDNLLFAYARGGRRGEGEENGDKFRLRRDCAARERVYSDIFDQPK